VARAISTTGFWDVLRPEAAEFIGEVIFCPDGGDAEARSFLWLGRKMG